MREINNRMALYDFFPYTHSPPTLPCVRHAADDGAEHEGCDEGKEHQVDQAFQAVIAQPRHSLYVVLRREKHTKQSHTQTHDNGTDVAIQAS